MTTQLERIPTPESNRSRDPETQSARCLIDQLTAQCGLIERPPDEVRTAETVAAVRRNLASAQSALNRRRSLRDRFHGGTLEEVYTRVHAAEVKLVEVTPDDELPSVAAHVLAHAARYLNRSDVRRTRAEQHTDDRHSLAVALRAAHAASDREHRRLRNLRKMLIAAILVVTAAVAVIAIAGFASPLVSLCFDSKDTGKACPTSTTGPKPYDVIFVCMLGMVGASLTSIASLRAMPPAGSSFVHVPLLLALLKLPLGALTAIIGLLLIHGGFVPGLSALDTPEQIAAWALVFGAAQQAVSQLLDTQARRLEQRAVRGPEPDPSRPGS